MLDSNVLKLTGQTCTRHKYSVISPPSSLLPCSPIPPLPSLPSPAVCTYTCHETCYKKVNKKCKSKQGDQLRTIDEEEAMRVSVRGHGKGSNEGERPWPWEGKQ